jgi:hypothetical protein
MLPERTVNIHRSSHLSFIRADLLLLVLNLSLMLLFSEFNSIGNQFPAIIRTNVYDMSRFRCRKEKDWHQ